MKILPINKASRNKKKKQSKLLTNHNIIKRPAKCVSDSP